MENTAGAIEAIECVLAEIGDAPTIEAEPVRHGRWYYTCSECYRKSVVQELYCPACGAKMDGGDEDD